MPKSKNKKDHKKRLAAYKLRKKQEQEKLKKLMYEKYIKAQEEYLASQQEHKDTEEQDVDIDIDVDDFTIDEDDNDNKK